MENGVKDAFARQYPLLSNSTRNTLIRKHTTTTFSPNNHMSFIKNERRNQDVGLLSLERIMGGNRNLDSKTSLNQSLELSRDNTFQSTLREEPATTEPRNYHLAVDSRESLKFPGLMESLNTPQNSSPIMIRSNRSTLKPTTMKEFKLQERDLPSSMRVSTDLNHLDHIDQNIRKTVRIRDIHKAEYLHRLKNNLHNQE